MMGASLVNGFQNKSEKNFVLPSLALAQAAKMHKGWHKVSILCDGDNAAII